MSFKYYFTVGARRVPQKRRGRGDGRLTGNDFNRFVRKPFYDRSFEKAQYNTRHNSYDAFDHSRIQADKFKRYRVLNAAHLPAVGLKKEVISRKGSDEVRLLPGNRFLPLK